MQRPYFITNDHPYELATDTEQVCCVPDCTRHATASIFHTRGNGPWKVSTTPAGHKDPGTGAWQAHVHEFCADCAEKVAAQRNAPGTTLEATR